MNTKNDKIELGDICINVAQKDIKNVHLSVHPPIGRVTVSAPLRMTLENVRLFIISKLGWIRKHQARMRGQKREAPREYVNRESHYYLGKRYLLKIVEQNSASKVVLNHDVIELCVHPNAIKTQKEALLQAWYRQQLKEIVLPCIEKLEKKEIKFLYDSLNAKDKFVVLPNNAAIYPLLKTHNPLIIDWVQPAEYVGNEDLFNNQLNELINNSDLFILIEKYNSKLISEKPELLDYREYSYIDLIMNKCTEIKTNSSYFRAFKTNK